MADQVSYISQGYPLFAAIAINFDSNNDPSTEQGRYNIADHAAETDKDLAQSMWVEPVIGWMLGEGESVPWAITTSGPISPMMLREFSVNRDEAHHKLLARRKEQRDRAKRRHKAHVEIGVAPENGRCGHEL